MNIHNTHIKQDYSIKKKLAKTRTSAGAGWFTWYVPVWVPSHGQQETGGPEDILYLCINERNNTAKCSQSATWMVKLLKQYLAQLWPRQTGGAQKYPHAQLGNVSI